MLPRRFLPFAVLALACYGAPALAAYTVRVDAPDSDLVKLLTEHLDLANERDNPDLDAEQLAALVDEAPAQARSLLETEGYFDAKVKVAKVDGGYLVSVEPGLPVIITDVTLRIDGAIHQEPDFQTRYAKLIEVWALPIGARFRQDDWASSKKLALRSLTVDRFPLAQVAESRAEIDPVSHRATLSARFDSGQRVTFGPLTIKGVQRYPKSVATGMADFNQGSPYQLSKVLDYQGALEQDAHYKSAIVTTDFSKLQNGQVPVDVEVVEQPRQKLELGLTYDSVEGPGVRVGYEQYNLFNRGWIGSALADVKRDQKTYSAGIGFPRTADGYSHSVNIKYDESEIQGLRTESLSGGAWRIRQRGNIESRIGLEYLSERSSIVDDGSLGRSNALFVSYGWTQRAVDDERHPRSGYLVDTKISTTLGGIGSNTQFVRGYAHAVGYYTPWASKYGTLIGRVEAGQVWAKDTDSVPEALLFRTGGPNSVRGYEYQSLGVAGPNGSVLGGRVLAVGSIEYQIPVATSWAVALFRDAGDAASSWQSYSVANSYGIGARWFSPVAPLSFDIAQAERDKRWRWNLSLGLAF
ncbi:autotransporter assembly complex family protein [Crenobacter sp. SG2303]|uniref:Autotransporter assembly complex family protein n=1 Tax=Crenobacter oryzisoli TaxID=3056844 RepID=A0ABT7XLR5_9NEIS|nr:autotransporter assembly complex family protein [Crenobacter sp. SG2303]MDN0074727.1 autotransporter assembly complex family protein [Crenobacter sp. SG2303]